MMLYRSICVIKKIITKTIFHSNTYICPYLSEFGLRTRIESFFYLYINFKKCIITNLVTKLMIILDALSNACGKYGSS